jgi:hypothetical protein
VSLPKAASSAMVIWNTNTSCDYSFLRCDVTQFGRLTPTFWNNRCICLQGKRVLAPVYQTTLYHIPMNTARPSQVLLVLPPPLVSINVYLYTGKERTFNPTGYKLN